MTTKTPRKRGTKEKRIMNLELTIEKTHQKRYDYDFYTVKFKGRNYRLIGTIEDVIANLSQDLLHMKATSETNKK